MARVKKIILNNARDFCKDLCWRLLLITDQHTFFVKVHILKVHNKFLGFGFNPSIISVLSGCHETVNVSGRNSRSGTPEISIFIFKLPASSSSHYSLKKHLKILTIHGYILRFHFCHLLHGNQCPDL